MMLCSMQDYDSAIEIVKMLPRSTRFQDVADVDQGPWSPSSLIISIMTTVCLYRRSNAVPEDLPNDTVVESVCVQVSCDVWEIAT